MIGDYYVSIHIFLSFAWFSQQENFWLSKKNKHTLVAGGVFVCIFNLVHKFFPEMKMKVPSTNHKRGFCSDACLLICYLGRLFWSWSCSHDTHISLTSSCDIDKGPCGTIRTLLTNILLVLVCSWGDTSWVAVISYDFQQSCFLCRQYHTVHLTERHNWLQSLVCNDVQWHNNNTLEHSGIPQGLANE